MHMFSDCYVPLRKNALIQPYYQIVSVPDSAFLYNIITKKTSPLHFKNELQRDVVSSLLALTNRVAYQSVRFFRNRGRPLAAAASW